MTTIVSEIGRVARVIADWKRVSVVWTAIHLDLTLAYLRAKWWVFLMALLMVERKSSSDFDYFLVV